MEALMFLIISILMAHACRMNVAGMSHQNAG